MEIILTHNNADFDGVAAMLAASKLYPTAVPVLPKKLNRNVQEFLTLYQNGLPFVRWQDRPAGPYERIILVDTQRFPDMKRLDRRTQTLVIDHHPVQRDLRPNMTFSGEEVGAVTTFLIEQLREQGSQITLTSLEATLLALGIYSDTGSLTYGTTTPRDVLAVAWLLEHQAVVDTIRRFISLPLTDEQRELLEKLLEAAQHRSIHGFDLIVSAVSIDKYIEQINSITHRLRNLLDPDAIAVIVQMPGQAQIVLRSRTDSIHVGKIAEAFNGGGHSRAAAANVRGRDLNAIVETLNNRIDEVVIPQVRVADLMSFGVQTVNSESTLESVIPHLRRIGHEGYPVLKDGQIIGLLTRRDADRAIEHGLGNARVQDVMVSGSVILSPMDPVGKLEEMMVGSGWGQIPVQDDTGRLLGIVTRTDLIKHWATVHPALEPARDRIEADALKNVLGATSALIDIVADFARTQDISIYLVGGVVRDVLLERPNFDLDFVVEGDAIIVAESLAADYGGEVHSFRPFGTAKWQLDETSAGRVGFVLAEVPDHIDFASARNEFYEHPTALPSVYSGSIKLDLHRRDFTINTLAVQLSPLNLSYRILDFYGGLRDLREGLLRVLHSLSFVDDPTRMLRAVRFEQRLGFRIETRTEELIQTALPMLRRITGERVRNELNLLFKEAEPEKGLIALQQRGILSAIHPDLSFQEDLISDIFPEIRGEHSGWPVQQLITANLYWCVLMAGIPAEKIPDVAERLLISKQMAETYINAAEIIQQPGILNQPHAKPSEIYDRLKSITSPALMTAWLLHKGHIRTHIEQYLTELHDVKTTLDGHSLRDLGVKPGPCMGMILQRLLDARLDGEITDAAQERQMAQQLLEQCL